MGSQTYINVTETFLTHIFLESSVAWGRRGVQSPLWAACPEGGPQLCGESGHTVHSAPRQWAWLQDGLPLGPFPLLPVVCGVMGGGGNYMYLQVWMPDNGQGRTRLKLPRPPILFRALAAFWWIEVERCLCSHYQAKMLILGEMHLFCSWPYLRECTLLVCFVPC